MPEAWVPVIETAALPVGRIVAVCVADDEAVIWRARDGRPCVMARRCPHLDWDLTEAVVIGDELLCAGHGWSLSADGRALKRNERGREDPKGEVRVWPVQERDGWIEVAPRTDDPGTLDPGAADPQATSA
jgi:phenylpropionate dioxygenase-like ring-hydroxylating dioxygenase large terminal subunit